jgi:RNA polymerase sigma factor (sigma-70 family)
MKDSRIVDLYWQRSEQAISETEAKYGSYCRKIASNILENSEDSEECVSDTWLSAWNSMPTNRPAKLLPYLGRICRNHALDILKGRSRIKRGGGECTVVFDELEDCIPSKISTEQAFELRELSRGLNTFLSSLKESERKVFMNRYWYGASVSEIAEKYGFTESKTSSMLFRTRRKLRAFLEREYL